MIIKAVITYSDGTEMTFLSTPPVPAVAEIPEIGVDLSTIPVDPVKVEDLIVEPQI